MSLLDRLTMRRCRQVAAVLQEYLDGEVDPVTAGKVHDHLEECRRCGLEARTYRAIKAAIPAADAGVAQIDVEQVLEAAMNAANLIGDGLYGVDVKQIGERAVVIEVNDNPSIDDGVEDAVLGDALYQQILGDFVRRLDEQRAARG